MDPKWEWIDTTFGIIVGAITAVLSLLGWINPKLAKIEEKQMAFRDDMDTRLEAVHERITENVQETTKLRAHREDDQRRLQATDDKLHKILARIPRTPWTN